MGRCYESLLTEHRQNDGLVLRVVGQKGLVAESHGFRTNDHLRAEWSSMFVNSGASSTLVIELIPAKHVAYSNRRRHPLPPHARARDAPKK